MAEGADGDDAHARAGLPDRPQQCGTSGVPAVIADDDAARACLRGHDANVLPAPRVRSGHDGLGAPHLRHRRRPRGRPSGLRLLLEEEPGFEVVAEAGDADDALPLRARPPARRARARPQHARARSSLDAIPRAARGVARTRGRRADDAGRAGVRPRGAARGRARLRAQGGGRRRAGRGGAARRARARPTSTRGWARSWPPRRRAGGPPDDLTEREAEILRLIALGHTNAEIAEQLYLAVRTVETHRAHIQQKLGPLDARRAGRATRSSTASSRCPAAEPRGPRRGTEALTIVALARRRVDLQLAARELDALAHPEQAEAVASRPAGSKPWPSSGPDEHDRRRRARDLDADALRAGVLGRRSSAPPARAGRACVSVSGVERARRRRRARGRSRRRARTPPRRARRAPRSPPRGRGVERGRAQLGDEVAQAPVMLSSIWAIGVVAARPRRPCGAAARGGQQDAAGPPSSCSVSSCSSRAQRVRSRSAASMLRRSRCSREALGGRDRDRGARGEAVQQALVVRRELAAGRRGRRRTGRRAPRPR